MAIRAVLFDFGGVISTSPFEAFARFEREHELPDGFIRRVNATDSDTNAWARLERNELGMDGFGEAFARESAALGHKVDGRDVLALLAGDLRPAMVEAVRRCHEHFRTGLLTNNFLPLPTGDAPTADAPGWGAPHAEVLRHFDAIVESSKVGIRKPSREFYEMACSLLEIQPAEAVFLDDLGINLKPALAMGMTTIKVEDPERALDELERVLGFSVRVA